jgi:hypothetical protein
VPEWLAFAGAAFFLLLVLLGAGWFLASTVPAKSPVAADVAVARADTAVEAEPFTFVPPEPPPIREKPFVPRESSEQTPPIQKPKPEEPAPSEQQKQPQEQAPIGQQQKPQEQKALGSLLDLPTVGPLPGQQAGQQPGAPPDGVKPFAPDRPVKEKPPSAIFMGVEVPAKRICVIADCSGSMAFNNRMTRLKLELWKTVKALKPGQEFYLIYFSGTAIPMTTRRPRKWWPAGKDMKIVRDWIGRQQPDGSTEPMPAFDIAFSLNPRPDAIFFLTDGIIPLTVPLGVARLNGAGKNKVPIHTILFGGELATADRRVVMVPVQVRGKITLVPRPVVGAKMEKDEGQLQQISRDSGGTHRFVPDDAKAGK